MKKKFLMALFFTGILVWAPAENMVPARADNLVDETVSRDGWVTEGNARYYYTDGKKATGFTKISGKTYFFDTKTGAQQTGFVVYGGKKYYFSPKTGAQVLGWAGINGQIYYFGQKGYALKGIYKIGSYRYSFNGLGELQKNTLVRGKYYADQRGRLARGWVTIGDNKYYFSYTNYAAVTGWRRIGGKVYYFNADGTLKKLSGVVRNSGNRYYYDPTTGEMTTGWVHSGVNDYYFSPKTGRALKGWQTINGKEYFFNSYGQLAKNRLVGNTYYVNDKGEKVYGWYTNGDKTYYLNSRTGVIMKKGWQTIDGKKYYFNADGSLAKGTWINDNQYLDENGSYASGWMEIDGKKYYFSKVNYKKLTGWKRVDDKVWYFGTDGVLRRLSGIRKTSDGLSYYFDPTTGEMTTGWIHYGVNDYYFSPKTGRMLTGWQTIDGEKYYLNTYGQLVKSRFVSNTYYVNEKGQRQYGWITIGEQKYYLNPSTGARSKGWKTINGEKYYFDMFGVMAKDTWIDKCYLTSDGTMAKSTWIGSEYVGSDGVKTGETRSPGLFTDKDGKTYLLDSSYQPVTGWQELDSSWYYFDTTTGEMAKDTWVDGYYLTSKGQRAKNTLIKVGSDTYLFDASGIKVLGLAEYNGNKYYFNSTNGAMQTGFRVVEGITYYFNPSKGGAMAVSTDLQIDGIYYTFDANGQMTTKTPLTENDALGKQIAAYAQQFVGYPYVFGGGEDLTKGVDCSGFTMLVLRHFGINVAHYTGWQYEGLAGYAKPVKIAVEDLKPGDLIFYYANNSHVGIYIGDGKIVHASNSAPYPQGGIKISNYDQAYIYGCVRYWYTKA